MVSGSIQIEVRKTREFDQWLFNMRDRTACARIFELRVDHGPGYRIYFTRLGPAVVLLLLGGDKGTQEADIRRAQQMLKSLVR